MKKFFCVLCILTLLSFLGASVSQAQSTNTRQKIAVFAPLYLDSAFDAMNTYRYAKNQFPEYINPGLEFYEGVQLALDSMGQQGTQLEVYVYDTRSVAESLEEQLAKPELDDVKLIIAYCSNNELRTFADAALRKNIPFINTNLPSDAGIRNNPSFVMLNSTLKTQCEGIYRYMQRYYGSNPIVVFRKKGQLEDYIKNTFIETGKNSVTPALNLKYVDLPDSFTVYHLRAHLDSNRHTLCVAGSLNDNFGKRLTAQLATLTKKYPLSVMGMPTWDGIKDFSKAEYKDMEIIYCTPFYNPRSDKVSASIINYFNTKMYARPSDMVMRGYEVMWRFGNLLTKYPVDFSSSITRKEFNVFREFDIQPVVNQQTMNLDYFENKKLYFIKWLNGLQKVSN